MALRFRYELEAFRQRVEIEPVLASVEVDPDVGGREVLRERLQRWAEARLRERACDFGLYVADFSAWCEDDVQDYYLRALYLIWDGSDVLAVYVDDNAATVAVSA